MPPTFLFPINYVVHDPPRRVYRKSLSFQKSLRILSLNSATTVEKSTACSLKVVNQRRQQTVFANVLGSIETLEDDTVNIISPAKLVGKVKIVFSEL